MRSVLFERFSGCGTIDPLYHFVMLSAPLLSVALWVRPFVPCLALAHINIGSEEGDTFPTPWRVSKQAHLSRVAIPIACLPFEHKVIRVVITLSSSWVMKYLRRDL
jgi:hypothetical protein